MESDTGSRMDALVQLLKKSRYKSVSCLCSAPSPHCALYFNPKIRTSEALPPSQTLIPLTTSLRAMLRLLSPCQP